MFARTTAAELANERDYDGALVVEVGRIKFDSSEHPSGLRLVAVKWERWTSPVVVSLEVGPSPAFGNDDEEPGFRAVFTLDPSATLGFEL